MKKIIKLLNSLESTPVNLVLSFLMALGVMFLLNGLLGSMGGIPAFIGFFLVFYLGRGISSKNSFFDEIKKNTNKQRVLWLLQNYIIGYLVLWAIARVVLMVSKVNGWGYIVGMSIGEYFTSLLGASMLERWAYFFVGILMFIFIISLFPLTIVQNITSFIWYLIADVLGYAVVCLLFTQLCNLLISNELEGRASSVLDKLLMCELTYDWEAALFIVGILILAMVSLIFSFLLACYFYEEGRNESKKLKIVGVVEICICGIIVAVLAKYMIERTQMLPKYTKVATYLTKDEDFGPISYYQTVYIPVNEYKEFCGESYAIGYLAEEDTNCDSRLYTLTTQNVLYSYPSWGNQYLQYYGTQNVLYKSLAIVQQEERWKDDQIFVMWDEEWKTESGYSGTKSGYTMCSSKFVNELHETYKDIDYRPMDFKDYDAYFTIYGYQNLEESFMDEVPVGDWAGCILVQDNRFYFGNMQNELTGDLKQALLDILGGNEAPVEENNSRHE